MDLFADLDLCLFVAMLGEVRESKREAIVLFNENKVSLNL